MIEAGLTVYELGQFRLDVMKRLLIKDGGARNAVPSPDGRPSSLRRSVGVVESKARPEEVKALVIQLKKAADLARPCGRASDSECLGIQTRRF